MTPKHFHFIHGLRRGDKFGLTDRIAVKSALVNNPDWGACVWSPEEPRGIHWEKLRDDCNVTWRAVPDTRVYRGNHIQHHQHRADLLRHSLLYALGGAYLDLDTITIAPIPPHWLLYDTVIGVERAAGDAVGLCNAVFLCEQWSQFQWEWLTLYQNFTGDDWNEFSVRAPLLLSKVFPRLVLTVEGQMLGHDYKECGRYFADDSLLTNIVIAHLYRTANGRAMGALTEESIRFGTSTYCLHAKQYL